GSHAHCPLPAVKPRSRDAVTPPHDSRSKADAEPHALAGPEQPLRNDTYFPPQPHILDEVAASVGRRCLRGGAFSHNKRDQRAKAGWSHVQHFTIGQNSATGFLNPRHTWMGIFARSGMQYAQSTVAASST